MIANELLNKWERALHCKEMPTIHSSQLTVLCAALFEMQLKYNKTLIHATYYQQYSMPLILYILFDIEQNIVMHERYTSERIISELDANNQSTYVAPNLYILNHQFEEDLHILRIDVEEFCIDNLRADAAHIIKKAIELGTLEIAPLFHIDCSEDIKKMTTYINITNDQKENCEF